MKNSDNKWPHRPARRMRFVQRTRMGMMPHQKIILASAFLFVFAFGFVVFVNLAEPGSTTAAPSMNGADKIENINISNGTTDNCVKNKKANADVKCNADTVVKKSFRK